VLSAEKPKSAAEDFGPEIPSQPLPLREPVYGQNAAAVFSSLRWMLLTGSLFFASKKDRWLQASVLHSFLLIIVYLTEASDIKCCLGDI
jgi:hypothetical protein